MGFGYVFIGYLISFLLYMPIDALGFVGLASLAGYLIMAAGLWTLSLYHNAFGIAKWLTVPMMVASLFSIGKSACTLFAWDLAFFQNGTVQMIYEWGSFVLIIAFQLFLLYGIRMISSDLELKQISVKAIRNSVFVAAYALLYVLTGLLPKAVAVAYLSLPLTLVQLVYTLFNLVLLINCAKDICPAGEEDQPPRRSRFALINRIGDAYERNQQKAIDRTVAEAQERARRRTEARNKKKIKHKKKK